MCNMQNASHGVASQKILFFLALFVVFLTLPHASHEFGFSFGDFGDSDGDGEDAVASTNSKQVTKRRSHIEKKFQFRKIERVFHDDTNDENDDDDDDMATKSKTNAAADNSRINEDEEFQFERARKARKERQPPEKGRSTTKRVVDAKKKRDNNDVSDEDDDDNVKDNDDEQSLLSKISFGLFSGDSSNTKSTKKKTALVQQTNGIIDWLQWLAAKTGHLKPPPPTPPVPEPTLIENIYAYLNRWPFNRIIPFDKPQKPIRVPRRVTRIIADETSTSTEATAPPMSQAHFESLLHKLPGFVLNLSEVADRECKQQLQIFQRQLRGYKLWTLQMLDATGKINAGVLRGNINQFGDFELCTQIKTIVKVTPDVPLRIRGKYCLAHIETEATVAELKVPVHLLHGRGLWNSHLGNPSHFVPRYAVANWGVCVPHFCSNDVVQEMIKMNLRPYNETGVEFNVEVDENDCSVRETRPLTKLLQKDVQLCATIFCLLTLALLVLTSLVHKYWAVMGNFIHSKWVTLKFRKNSATDTVVSEEELVEESGKPSVEEIIKENDETIVDESIVDEAETRAVEDAATVGANLSLKLLALEIFRSFSPKRTLDTLLSPARAESTFSLLHVLKLVATFMLYMSLKYLMIGHLPITNRDRLVRLFDQPLSIVLRAPVIYADILLLVSGFLSAYQLSAEMHSKLHIQWLKRLLSKVTRCLPAAFVVLCFQTWVLPYFGSGPLWSNLIGEHTHLCEQQMWRNLFGIQNVIDFEETCSPMTIQLALEFQLFLLGPLIVWLFHTDADAGFFVYSALHAMSVAARFSRTNREHLSITLFHGMNVSKFYRTANMLYASPISRATTYLLGIGAGMLYHSQPESLEVAPELVPVGWTLAALGLLWCFWSPATGMRSDFIYKSSDAAAYASWSPLILGLALCWIIFKFPKQEKSYLSAFASTQPIVFLSRITFPIQLAMFVVVMYNTGTVKDSLKYHLTDLFNVNEILTIVLLATILAFLIDVPAQNIRRLVINWIFHERAHQESEPVSGAEQSDTEIGETCEIPKPAEAVWSSDPEEEEKKYIARRRSSTIVRDENNDKQTVKEQENKHKEEEMEAEDEEDVEEDEDIAEEDEVKKRPETPPVSKEVKAEELKSTRRRRPTSGDGD